MSGDSSWPRLWRLQTLLSTFTYYVSLSILSAPKWTHQSQQHDTAMKSCMPKWRCPVYIRAFKRNEKPVIRQYLCFSLNNDGMLVPMYCNVDCTLSSLTLIPLTNTGKHNYFPQNATRCYGVQKGITWDDVTRDYACSRPPAPSQPYSPFQLTITFVSRIHLLVQLGRWSFHY